MFSSSSLSYPRSNKHSHAHHVNEETIYSSLPARKIKKKSKDCHICEDRTYGLLSCVRNLVV